MPIEEPSIEEVLVYLKGLHQMVDVNLYGQGISISEGRMKIFVPRDKISWSFKLEVSSELVDTYVQ